MSRIEEISIEQYEKQSGRKLHDDNNKEVTAKVNLLLD